MVSRSFCVPPGLVAATAAAAIIPKSWRSGRSPTCVSSCATAKQALGESDRGACGSVSSRGRARRRYGRHRRDALNGAEHGGRRLWPKWRWLGRRTTRRDGLLQTSCQSCCASQINMFSLIVNLTNRQAKPVAKLPQIQTFYSNLNSTVSKFEPLTYSILLTP